MDQRDDAAVGQAVIPGLRYVPGFLSPGEQRFLLETLDAIRFDQWQQVRMRGQLARRRKLAYGYTYEPSDRALSDAPPIPGYLLPLRERCAAVLGVAPEILAQATLTLYPPGAGIGRHKDAPFFGDKVIGVSLGSEARMVFRHGKEKVPLTLEPGSLLVLTGPARSVWTHEMPPVAAMRYSIYFRSLKQRRAWG